MIATVAIAAPCMAHYFAATLPVSVSWAAPIMATASGFVTLVLSAIILFDALLFRLIASHDHESEAGAAVDDILVRMRLKSSPAPNRSLAERIVGTNRLILKQRLSLALFIAAAAVAVFGVRS